ncbi:uncharacterized protein ARMOST_17569 [Armillaria ostoyae]|uniref:F-box domain-containing protein n=1 Tax=Armillaria ostoyae TaxID=47428 RepID=A0A284RZC7_ARMOS|nr:uncharacterized protein ARMOST_17569 [Armillaria ostoyae]
MTTPFKKSDSSLSVPQELLDYILDFLHNDVPTLRTCSLVSHAFLPCSRYHTYSSVFIVHVCELHIFRERYAGQAYKSKDLAALLEYSPHVAPLVTRFGIHAKLDWMSDIFMDSDTNLSPIISSLKNLSYIEIITREYQGFWADFPVTTLKVFLAALRSVPLKTFICNGISFGQGQFEDLLTATANPALKHMSLVNDDGAAHTFEPYPPIRPPPDGLPTLESLCIAGDAVSSNIAWLFFHQSLYDIRGLRHLSLQIYDGTTSSLLQGLLNEMQGSLESFTLDVIPWKDQGVRLDLSQHRMLSAFFMILASPVDPRLVGMRLSPVLQTFSVEQMHHSWEYNSRETVDAWAEFEAHLDMLTLPALQRVHVRLHDSTHGVCYCFECHGHECDCRKCRGDPLGDCHNYRVSVDYDKWKCRVENIMPLLRGRGILEVEVVKQRYCIQRAFD